MRTPVLKPLFLKKDAQDAIRAIKRLPSSPLYVYRSVVNAQEILDHFAGQGLRTVIPPEEMHVTITYSENPVQWLDMGAPWYSDENGGLTVPPGGPRQVIRLGKKSEALALAFVSYEIEGRHSSMIDRGASWKWPEYHPHLTLTYDAPEDLDEATLKPWTGKIVFGPEIFEPINPNFLENLTEQPAKARVIKVDSKLGIVFGWAIVCKEFGEDYYDLNIDRDGAMKGQRVPEHIPEDEMLKAALDFSENTSRPGNEMHKGPPVGQHVFLFPLTTEIAKSLGIQTDKTGLLIAYKPPKDVLAKFESGEYTGFSIEGMTSGSEVIDG